MLIVEDYPERAVVGDRVRRYGQLVVGVELVAACELVIPASLGRVADPPIAVHHLVRGPAGEVQLVANINPLFRPTVDEVQIRDLVSPALHWRDRPPLPQGHVEQLLLGDGRALVRQLAALAQFFVAGIDLRAELGHRRPAGIAGGQHFPKQAVSIALRSFTAALEVLRGRVDAEPRPGQEHRVEHGDAEPFAGDELPAGNRFGQDHLHVLEANLGRERS